MGQAEIREFVEEDIPQVVQLRKRCFRFTQKPAFDDQCAYFKGLFFQNPWKKEGLPSLVYQADDGTIKGFLGVLPRPMLIGNERIRVAISTSFMVDPGARSALVGVVLLKRFLDGPQDMSLADIASPVTRKLWESLGGTTALLYSLYWRRPLRPGRYNLHLFQNCGMPRLLSLVAKPMICIGDYIATRLAGSPYRAIKPSGSLDDMNADMWVQHLCEFSGKGSLRPIYDKHSLQWLIGEISQKTTLGFLRKALVKKGDYEVVGAYAYCINPGGISQVIQVSASKGSIDFVLDHLFYDAWERGVIALAGRLDPVFVGQLSNKGCFFDRGGPFVLIHSRNHRIVQEVQNGNAFLTRMEGEWCMNF